MKRFNRSSGILLHPTALPGPQGIGTLGNPSRRFLQWLKEAGQTYWQICPLLPTGYGDSPYQGFSAFAGNPNLVDMEDLRAEALLSQDDLQAFANLPEHKVDFGTLIPLIIETLHKAWISFNSGNISREISMAFDEFRETSFWLEDYCLFRTIKDKFRGESWHKWPRDLKLRKHRALRAFSRHSAQELEFQAFIQFLFDRQWKSLKSMANHLGIKIIGDSPIFVAYDSSDCWSRPELFQLDSERLPTHVAGVPPDYFSETGQLWGNPLYDWESMEHRGYQWWIEVLATKLKQYDVLRMDHFRGFSAFWAVPFGEETAVNGKWMPAHGEALFSKAESQLGELNIIAEDLGLITQDVVALIEKFAFPRMKVLQFAFDSSEDNDYLPHNYENHCVVYTGTHDNDTAVGWYESAAEKDRIFARRYMNLPETATAGDAAEAMFRAAMESRADLAITPLQDVLGLGSQARFNRPGILGDNWVWRISDDLWNTTRCSEIQDMTRLSGRLSVG